MATQIDLAPIPEGAQTLTYRVVIVLDNGIEVAYRLRLGARIATLIANAQMDGVFVQTIPTIGDRDLNSNLCQVNVELGYDGQVPPSSAE